MTTNTITNDLKYEVTGSKVPKKASIQVISEMSTTKILWHLAKRHSLSLWQLYAIGTTAMLIYIVTR
jgi:hypothetical protein